MNYTQLTNIKPGLKDFLNQNWKKVAHKALIIKCNKPESQRKTTRVFWKRSVEETFIMLQTKKEVELVADTISNRFAQHKHESEWDSYRNQLPGIFQSNSTTIPEKQNQTNTVYQIFPGVKPDDGFELIIRTTDCESINQHFMVTGSQMSTLLRAWGDFLSPLQNNHE